MIVHVVILILLSMSLLVIILVPILERMFSSEWMSRSVTALVRRFHV